MTRETTICVSTEEKERLDEAAKVIFGTESVPYGEIVTELCNEMIESVPSDRRGVR
jgi:predicted DNA-binding protein